MIFDETFFALIGLLLFIGLLVKLGLPQKLVGALDDRARRIRNELDEARRLREEAQSLLADYQRRAREAHKEAEAIVDEAKAEAQRLSTEASEALDVTIERRLKAADQKIAQAEARAISEIRSVAVDVAVDAASKIIAGHIESDKDNKTLNNSIRQIVSNLN